ncbi:MAG: calcium-binding protein [Pseudomonadota bacterium]
MFSACFDLKQILTVSPLLSSCSNIRVQRQWQHLAMEETMEEIFGLEGLAASLNEAFGSTALLDLAVSLEAAGAIALSVGTPGDDDIRPQTDSNIILGLEGNDKLFGGDGFDLIVGGPGNDSIFPNGGLNLVFGGFGNDFMQAFTGVDIMLGGPGNDVFFGNAAGDFLFGEDGDDVMRGEQGGDFLFGGNNRDWLLGDEGDDLLDGGTANDRLEGGDGADILLGGTGADSLFGGEGDDVLDGGAGNDVLEGAEGDDVLLGGDGHDDLWSGLGDDLLAGGNGRDNFFMFGRPIPPFGPAPEVDRILDYKPGHDTLFFAAEAAQLGRVLGDEIAFLEIGDDFGPLGSSGDLYIVEDRADVQIIADNDLSGSLTVVDYVVIVENARAESVFEDISVFHD